MGADRHSQYRERMNEAPARWDFAVAPPRIAPGVQSMLGYRGLDIPETVHRGLPSASLTFIVSLDDGVEATAVAADLPGSKPIPVLLGGLHVQASHVRQRPGQAGVQVALHPLATRALFGVPAAELSVSEFDGSALLGHPARRLHERITEARGWPAAFDLMAGDLADRRHRYEGPGPRPEVVGAWRLLESSRGTRSVRDVAREVGLTQRHLSTLFAREVGRSPKTVGMLMRFDAVIARLAAFVHAGLRPDLAAVAVEAGYSDQAHLTREFVRFSGVPPTAWLAEEFRNLQDGGHEWRPD